MKLISTLMLGLMMTNANALEGKYNFDPSHAKVGFEVAHMVISNVEGRFNKFEGTMTAGKKLTDFSDLVLDTGAPVGDAMVRLEGLDTPVSPGSTVGGAAIVNCLKAETAQLLTQAGRPPKVLSAAAVVGSERAVELFEAAYDEHAHRLAKMYQQIGTPSYVSDSL